jgi:probable phosphoglycerate mutase
MLEKKSFYFVRHGESEHNQRGLVAGGKTDSPLTEKGIAQALGLKEKLLAVGIEHVISSPMLRAKKTSELAWTGTLDIDENLREFELGIFEGIEDKGVTEYVIDLTYDVPVPDGESKKEFVQRITSSINKWLNTYERPLLFVAHGFIWGILLHLMELPIYNSDGTLITDLENCTLAHFSYNGLRWEVKYL